MRLVQSTSGAESTLRHSPGSDIAFNEAVIEVNVALAREDSRLYYERPSNVRGINFDPGNTHFNPDRDLPSFAGTPRRVPSFRNRLIGDIDFADSLSMVDAAMAHRISIRADEGEPFAIGHIARMGSNVIVNNVFFGNVEW